MKPLRNILILIFVVLLIPELLPAEGILSIKSSDSLYKSFSKASGLYLTALQENTPESYKLAGKAFSGVVNSTPRNSSAFIYQGDCLSGAGNDPVKAYETALRLLMEKKEKRDQILPDIKEPYLLSDIVYCLNALGHFHEARSLGLQAPEPGENADLFINLAYTYYKLEDMDLAREYLCRASGIKPAVNFQDRISYRRISQLIEKKHVFTNFECGTPPAMEKGTSYALLISVGDYRFRSMGFTSLPFAGNDVRDLRRTLTDPVRGAFPRENVIELKNSYATLRKIKESFDNLAAHVREEDTVLVFLSGHGYTSPLTSESYFMTYDTEIGSGNGNRIDSTAFSVKELTKKIKALESKNIVFFLDISRNRGAVGQLPFMGLDKDLGPGKNYAIITSSRPDQLSMGVTEYRHGLFAHHLISGLGGEAENNGDGRVEFEELWPHVRERVSEDAKLFGREQLPQIFNSSGSSIYLTKNPDY